MVHVCRATGRPKAARGQGDHLQMLVALAGTSELTSIVEHQSLEFG